MQLDAEMHTTNFLVPMGAGFNLEIKIYSEWPALSESIKAKTESSCIILVSVSLVLL